MTRRWINECIASEAGVVAGAGPACACCDVLPDVVGGVYSQACVFVCLHVCVQDLAAFGLASLGGAYQVRHAT
jgi:hypothetical protein